MESQQQQLPSASHLEDHELLAVGEGLIDEIPHRPPGLLPVLVDVVGAAVEVEAAVVAAGLWARVATGEGAAAAAAESAATGAAC